MAAIADGGKSKGTPARKSSRVAAKEGSKPRDAKPSKPKQPKQKLNKSRVVAEKKKPASRPEPTHPTYFEMVVEAIAALKERSGSSRIAIAKYIEERYKSELPGNFKKLLNNQLRNLSEKGQITQVKGSFKLTDELKKSSAVKAVNKVAEPKPPKKLKVAKISQVKSPKAAPKSPKLAEPATDHEEPTPKPKAARGRPSAGNRKPVPSPAPKPEKMPSVAKKEKPKPSKPKSSSTPANRKSPRAPPASSKKTTAAPPPAKRTRK